MRQNVTPDRVSPTVESYFRVPPVWIGGKPDASIANSQLPAWGHQTVLEHSMLCGIKARVQRDGLFVFDFTDFAPATFVVIPGYVKPKLPYTIPKEHTDAQNKAEEIAVYRAQIMNAHQAFFSTAESIITRSSSDLGFPVNAWNTFKSIDFYGVPAYNNDTHNERAVARDVLNNIYGIEDDYLRERNSIGINVAKLSFDLLDQIAASRQAISMVEGAYMAACRLEEKRFGESIVLGWTVCEQLINIAWKQLLDSKKVHESENLMTNKRIEKLIGRDYTASVIIEILEIQGVISAKLYRKLEISRKARNKWAHEMKSPGEAEVRACLSAFQAFLKQLLSVDLNLNNGSRGGVPEWPIWMLERLK